MISISPDQVRAEIRRFWQIRCGKSPDRLEDLYSPSALILTGKGRKPEEADTVLARRTRHISAPDLDATADLGAVEVQIPEPGVAVASYTYKFCQTRRGEHGGVEKRQTLNGRATQVFQLDARGAMRIVHEHLSAAANPEMEKSGGS
jgi:ketosteroid isomerase-like protein